MQSLGSACACIHFFFGMRIRVHATVVAVFFQFLQLNTCKVTYTPHHFDFCISATIYLPAAGIFLLCCGAHRGPACTRRNSRSPPGSLARALGVHRCAIRQVIAGRTSAQLEPSRAMETPRFRSLLPGCCCTTSSILRRTWFVCTTLSPKLSTICSHGTTTDAYQALPL